MYFIDSHIHLQAFQAKTAPQIIAEAAACGVNKLVCASIIEGDWAKLSALATEFPDTVTPAFGVHPWYLDNLSAGWQQRLAAVLEQSPTALIGETGLDRIHQPEPAEQTAVFKVHLELAEQFNRPLLIHAVKANEWLEPFWETLSERRFVFHSFNGRRELLDKVLTAGGYISFSNSILRNRDFTALAQAIPLDRLLFETDGPFQGDGKDSHPCQIPDLCAKIAAVRGETAASLAAAVYDNSLRFIHV